MRFLGEMKPEEKDHIRLMVGNTYLNLNIRQHHAVFTEQYNTLIRITKPSYKEEVKLLLCCITYALKHLDLGFYLVRNKQHYLTFNKDNQKYNKLSHYKLLKLLDRLEYLGYVENYSGYNNRETEDKMSSCVVFTDKLVAMFPSEDINKYGKSVTNEYAVVREKVSVDGEDTDLLVEIKNVQGIGKHKQEVKELEDWLNTHKFKFVTHEKKIDLQRIFYERLDCGGRFYFGGLQCLESDKRRLYKIDECSVTERDYQSNHLLIIAEKKEIFLPQDFDPYDVDVNHLMKCDDPKRVRNIIKMCCMFLLNSGTPEATFKKFWKKNITLIDKFIGEGDWVSAKGNMFYGVSGLHHSKQIIRRVESYNSYAKSHFRVAGGVWGELQYLDSEILLRIMRKMKNIDAPFLPYHDSVLTPVKYGDVLENFMYEAWAEVLGSNFNCRITNKF